MPPHTRTVTTANSKTAAIVEACLDRGISPSKADLVRFAGLGHLGTRRAWRIMRRVSRRQINA